MNIYRDTTKGGSSDGGSLTFDDPPTGGTTDFWAESILVENLGKLIAGAPPTVGTPIGTNGGVVTIYLYGPNKGDNVGGILCQTPTDKDTGPCGIPLNLWTSNNPPTPASCNPADFP